MVASLPMPRGLGRLDQEEQLFVGSVSPVGSARGSKRATIAVAHKLLVIAYHILRDGTCYSDLGADYFDRLNPEGLRRRLTKRLEGWGFKVTLEPVSSSRLPHSGQWNQ